MLHLSKQTFQTFLRSTLGKYLILGVCLALLAGTCPVFGQEEPDPSDSDPVAAAELVEINWLAKLMEGGMTMVVLALLSVAALAFSIERAVSLKKHKIVPEDLRKTVVGKLKARNWEGAVDACEQAPCTLSRILLHILRHCNQPMAEVSDGAGDLAGREVRDMLTRISPLAVIASLAPLLGLLGTMIGMIEAFELVSIYGDDGGASMLASSIAKALITTAVGLIVAIPCIGAYHFFKHRVNALITEIEMAVDEVISVIYAGAAAKAVAEPATGLDGAKAQEPVAE